MPRKSEAPEIQQGLAVLDMILRNELENHPETPLSNFVALYLDGEWESEEVKTALDSSSILHRLVSCCLNINPNRIHSFYIEERPIDLENGFIQRACNAMDEIKFVVYEGVLGDLEPARHNKGQRFFSTYKPGDDPDRMVKGRNGEVWYKIIGFARSVNEARSIIEKI